MELPLTPRWVYTDSLSAVDYHMRLPQREWTAGTSAVGGSDVSAAGVPAAFQIRRDYPWALTLRFPEREWPNVERLVTHLQRAGSATLYPDRLRPESFVVYLISPAIGEEARPRRGEEPSTLELDIVVRPTTSTVVRAKYHDKALWRFSAGDDSRHITFTRSGAIGARRAFGGLQEQMPANVLRTTWAMQNGVLRPFTRLEIPRTNKFARSQEPDNAAWTKGEVTIVPNNGMGPDGALVLDSIIESVNNSNHFVSQAVTGMTPNDFFALSGWFIAADRTWVRLSIFETAASANIVNAWFNLATGAVGTQSVGGTATAVQRYIEDWTHVYPGLYRCVNDGIVGNGATAITGYFELATGDGGGAYDGDGASGLFGGCFQLEHGREASSYIPTTTVELARGAEAFSDVFPYTQQQLAAMGGATFYGDYVEGMFPPWEYADHPRLIVVGDAADSPPALWIYRSFGSDGIYISRRGTPNNDSGVDLNPVRGDRIQFAGQLLPTGAVRMLGRKNGVTDADGGVSGVGAPLTAFSAELIHLNGAGAAGRGITEYADAVVFPGLLDIDECEREAASS